MANTQNLLDMASTGHQLYGATQGGAGLTGFGNAAGGYAAIATPLLMGMFGMPSGAATVRASKKRKADAALSRILPQLEAQVPGGMTRQEYIASRQPPKTPWEIEQESIRKSGVGDVDYEIEEAFNQYNNGWGKAANEKFLSNPENAKWYNADMSRTDYAGEYAPALSVQREQALNGGWKPSIQQYPSQKGVLPSPQRNVGALAIPESTTPDRPQWLAADAPRQTFNGQNLYEAMKQYTPHNHFGVR